jgi:hypothetical protein
MQTGEPRGGSLNLDRVKKYISNIGNTPATKKGIIPHRKIKERKAHNNCLRKTSNNRRKTKAFTAHSSITTTLMD